MQTNIHMLACQVCVAVTDKL